MAIKKIKILIVDDHKMIRDGIRAMLESQNKQYNFIITESDSGEDAIDKIIINDFDIVLMDYQLPKLNGADTVKQMVIYKSSIKILALSNYDEYIYIKDMMKSGAKGYVLKNISPGELIHAIHTILSGKNYYANDIAIKLIETQPSSNTKFDKQNNYGLTKRELEILQLIVNEMTNDEIARNLNIEKRTVDSHRQNMLKKLRAKNTVALVKCAYEYKLVM